MFKRFRSRKGSSKEEGGGTVSGSSDPDLARGRTNEFLLVASDTSATSTSRVRSPSPSGHGLGLHVLHQPDTVALDIVFVHGLGGHSQKTWSKNHDPNLFWPELWLPFEPDVSMARILTFGYNAAWRGATKSIASVTDFAKELLFELRFSKDNAGVDLGIGDNPIIFVAHSLGGLVVKKAYLLGIHDENYKQIVGSVSAMMFLSTPHRGSNFAETLNRVLAASFQSSKNFISDLNKSSPAIEEINEQFRHLAPRLSIWSFYETQSTPVGPRKIMVLEKDTTVLGYPAEVSRPLHADHHDVCKYSGPTDSNYVSVTNGIRTLVARFRSTEVPSTESDKAANFAAVQELFRNCPSSDNDYSNLRRSWVPQTCEWFLKESEVGLWMEPSSESSILWYSAPPASGKSTLSAFIINHLRCSGMPCQFFLFKYSDNSKRSVANCLQSLACQLAKTLPEFTRLLGRSSGESLGLDSGDVSLIWRNIFENLLFETNVSHPIYWVIDALDESDSPRQFLDCLRSLSDAKIPVRILIFSRSTDSMVMNLDRLSHAIPISRIEKTGQAYNREDIKFFVERELDHMRGSDQFRQQLTKEIVGRSEANFLWTRLVLDEILGCHTEEDIREVLEEVPDDMTQLYRRMEKSLIGSTRRSKLPLIKGILEWCTCAQRPLNLKELSQAIQPEFSGFLDLKRTIKDACGQFVSVDDHGKVDILHHTAREYFTRSSDSQLHINARKTHENLFARTIAVFGEIELQWRLRQSQHTLQASEPFVFYAAISWPFHLGHSNSSSSETLDILMDFFRSSAVLVWIHTLALLRRLEILVKASKVLASTVKHIRKRNASRNPMLHRLLDLESLDEWIVDLTKLVGKFAHNLVTQPEVSCNIIPALCPPKSAVYQQFHKLAKIKVLGTGHEGWSDNLCRLALPGNAQAWKVSCAGKFVVVLASTGNVHVWDGSNFTQVAVISHGEPVTAMGLSGNGGKLSTYGIKSTKLWAIPSGKNLASTTNPPNAKAMSLVFVDHDERLLVCGDDNIVRHIRCAEFERGWQVLNPELLRESARIDNAVVNSPMCAVFSRDGTYIGVSYRGAPLSVWRVADGHCINRCKRIKEIRGDQRRPSSNWFAVDRFTWNPITGHVLGIYRDGCIFKWHPMTEEHIETQWSADEIAASSNGKLFATSSSNGSVRVWSFAYFSVIYQLSSENLVTELAFSPDSRRFYDLRDGSVNSWEPNSLARFLETDESVSDTNSEDQSLTAITRFSEEWAAHFEAVTAFAIAPDGKSYLVGREDGTVASYQKGDVEGTDFAQFHNFLPVTHIRYNADGQYLALADLAGDVQIKEFSSDPGTGVETKPLPAPRIRLEDRNIEEMLFSPDGHLLLITTRSEAFICRTVAGDLRASVDLEDSNRRKWMCHPTRSDIILGWGACDVQAYAWDSFDHVGSCVYHNARQRPIIGEFDSSALGIAGFDNLRVTDDTTLSVAAAFLTQDRRYILLEVDAAHESSGNVKHLTLFPMTSFDMVDEVPGLPASLGGLELPADISMRIRRPLGTLHGTQLVFLDSDLWLCVAPLDLLFQVDVIETSRRLYFLPRDWIGRDSLANCALTEDGTLFCTKDDRVVLIESDLGRLDASLL